MAGEGRRGRSIQKVLKSSKLGNEGCGEGWISWAMLPDISRWAGLGLRRWDNEFKICLGATKAP